jgi:hypothetical protein
VKHAQELAQKVVDAGGAGALGLYLKDLENDGLIAVMAVRFIASFSQALAQALLQESAAPVILGVFVGTREVHVKSPAAWAIAQLGKHSPEQAGQLTSQNTLALLFNAHNDQNIGEHLRLKTKRSLKFIIEKCNEIDALQPLVETGPIRLRNA